VDDRASALDRIMLHAWKPSQIFRIQSVEPKSFELQLQNLSSNSPRNCFVAVAIVVVVVIIIVVIVIVIIVIIVVTIFDVGREEIIITFRPKWLEILLRDLCKWHNDMRHADVDDVWKTLNTVLELIEFKIEVMVLQ
jgi:hypothetical protein